MRVFLVWKRRCADVRAGTQAPPLRILLERIARGTVGGFEQIAHGCSPLHISFGWIVSGRLMLFGWITRGWLVPFGDDCARMYNGDG